VSDLAVPCQAELETPRLTATLPERASGLSPQPKTRTFMETMPDGTRVLYRADGMPIRQWGADGSIVSFDSQGNPVTETTVDGREQPPTHGTPPADPANLVADQPDGQGRPSGVTFPDGTRARYEYQPDGGRVVRYSTGVVTTEDGTGRLLTERLPDGTLYNSFDSQGRPNGGTLPDGDPFQQRYTPEGPVRQPPGVPAIVDPGGQPVRQVTADGTTLDGFDGQGRPTSGVTPAGDRFTITYDAQGDSFQHFADGSTVEFSPGGMVLSQVTADGTTFDGFDGQSRPTSGLTANGDRFTITYDAQGDSFQHFSDGSTVEFSPGGKVLSQVTADGTTFDGFDGQGRPNSGTSPDGTRFTITYDAQGDSFQHFSDGTTVEYSPGGKVLSQVTADGTTFDGFDSQGRPTSGTLPDGTHFTITYDAEGDSFQHFSDGTTVEYSSSGAVIKEITADGTTYDSFDSQGRPTSGTSADGTHFTITYDAEGDVFEHFDDGSTTEFDSHGTPIKTWNADGTEITWAVDLPALDAAASGVAAQAAIIENNVQSLKLVFNTIESIWESPAGMSLGPLVNTFNMVTDGLVELLNEAVTRMRIAYQNYTSTESTNANNLG
jgi:YD repeat-containing protein